MDCDTKVRILRTTKAILSEPENWVQKTWGKGGKYCLEWAIYEACRRNQGDYRPILAEVAETVGGNVILYNDHADRKHADVINMLQRTIERIENGIEAQ